jgi:hypothetical protein
VVLCARSIKPFERGHPVCGGRGWEFNDGKERREGWPRPSARVHHVTPWVQQLLAAKKCSEEGVEEWERRGLSDGKAERCEPRRGTRRIRIAESAFMLQR